MRELMPLAEKAGALLRARKQTIALNESSTGGLISAALLAVPGASVYFQGGGIIYTRIAGKELFDITREQIAGMRSSSEPYALFMARTVRSKLAATWGLCETGAAGPTGNRYGDASGHSCFAVVGPREESLTLETGSEDRVANMRAFAKGALELLERHLK